MINVRLFESVCIDPRISNARATQVSGSDQTSTFHLILNEDILYNFDRQKTLNLDMHPGDCDLAD